MGSLKRKEGPGGPSTSKSVQTTSESRPSKRPKPSDSVRDDSKTTEKKGKGRRQPKSSDPKATTAPTVSLLKEDEPLFPRGGGSILTPFEQKQIQVQAKNDVLFEQESGSSAKKAEKGAKKKKRRSEGPSIQVRDEDAVKIESLNFKRLVKGSLVLGTIAAINSAGLSVALPNNLVGQVALTSISDALTERLEAMAEKEDEEDNDADVESLLKSLFRTGQYVRAYVESTLDEFSTVGKPKKRIVLSLQPSLANSGMKAQDVVPNCTLMASVVSVEDHGFVMDISIAESSNMQGFLPRKQLDKSIPEELIQPGSVLLCAVTGKKANGKVVQLSTLQDKLGNVKSNPTEATTIHTFLPGTAVDILISDVSQHGLIGKVMGDLDVTADLVHSGAGPDLVDLDAKYKAGSRVKGRIICNFPSAKKPKLGFSVLPHVAALKPKSTTEDGKEIQPLEVLPHSAQVETCTVHRVEPDIGLYVDIGVAGVPGFVHISRVKDGKIDALFENSGPFKVGSSHQGRVVGYNPFDGIFLITFEKSVLEQPFIRVEDIPIGAVIRGVVEKLIINSDGFGGLVVEISKGISGLVPEMHVSDIRLQHPEKMFREGSKVKARVLSVNPVQNKVRLTLKKTLVNSDVPAIKSYEDLRIGLQTTGTIIKLFPSGAILQFYGQLRGFLPVSQMSEAYIRDATEHFVLGSALSVRVLSFDAEKKKLVLTAKTPGLDNEKSLKGTEKGNEKPAKPCPEAKKAEENEKGNSTKSTKPTLNNDLTWNTIEKGMVVAGRITKVDDRHAMVKLSESLAGPVYLPDLTDDFDEANPLKLGRFKMVWVSIVDVDRSNKKMRLSMRPSRVLNSSLPVKDREISKTSKLEVGETIRGFVKNVSDKGLFVTLGGDVTAMVQIRNLSDDFLKEWKDHFQVDQIVKGRIISISEGRIEMSLKKSVLEKDFVPLITISDLKEGQIVTGKVRKVEDFGAFIDISGSDKVSGLCHRSEMAERVVKDAKTLYNQGDKVKAIVLKVDQKQKRVSLGLKPSYFKDGDDEMDIDGNDEGAPLESDDDADEDEQMSDAGGAVLIEAADSVKDGSADDSDESDSGHVEIADEQIGDLSGLDTGGFDWTGSALDVDDEVDATADIGASKKTKKRREPQIQIDKTAELDVNGPQTINDFERLLLGQPNDSGLWIQYMALQLKLSDLEAARKVAERAIKTINMKEEAEKLNVWTALLNLEATYGADEAVDSVFKRACTYNDEQEVHERLASIYIQSGKYPKADDLFEKILKKFGSKSVDVWVNYAHFLHTKAGSPDRARALLKRATQVLGSQAHMYLSLVPKFAALEFRSPNGDRDQGRTLFENLLATYPKKFDLWNQLLDLETSTAVGEADLAVIRDLFDRGTKVKALKPKQAKAWFRRWANWEEQKGDAKSRERVSAKAQEWARTRQAGKQKQGESDGE